MLATDLQIEREKERERERVRGSVLLNQRQVEGGVVVIKSTQHSNRMHLSELYLVTNL